MAIRYAVATGNWSSLATWDGGASLPTVGDEVHANGFTVTINQDIDVLHISTRANAPAAAGGAFQVTASGRTLTCDVLAGTTLPFVVSGANNVFTLNGNLEGSPTNGVNAMRTSCSGASILVINGNVTGGSFANSIALTTLGTPAGSLTINGDLIGGANSSAAAQLDAVSLAVVINGNVEAGALTTAIGLDIRACISCNISGNVTSSISGTGVGVSQSGTSTGTITIGGDVNSYVGIGVSINAVGRTVNILGDVISHGAANAVSSYQANTTVSARDIIRIGSASAISFTGINTLLVFRKVIQDPTATTQQFAISISQYANSWAVGESLDFGVDGMSPINGRVYFKDLSTSTLTMPLELGGTIELGRTDGLDWNDTTLFPDEDNVRFGVDYADSNKTGNAVFPSASLVADGTGYGASGTEYTGTLGVCSGGGGGGSSDYDNLVIINEGIKKASLMIPHTTDLIAP